MTPAAAAQRSRQSAGAAAGCSGRVFAPCRISPCLATVRRRVLAAAAGGALPQLVASSEAAAAQARDAAQHVADRLTAMYVLADASAAVAQQPTPTSSRAGGIFEPLADGLEAVLKVLQGGLDQLHVPYSYGWSIILLTLIVKAVTYPLAKQQVESALAVQALKPRIDLIKARFGDDKEKVQKETSFLYEQAGVNPLAGCLPTLATIPIFIGLYSSLSNVANAGLLDNQGFYWLPSLAGPTTMAERQSGAGTSWLFPLVDGAPPIGWDEASAYLILPVALLLVQYASNSVTSPPVNPNDEGANTSRILMVLLPLMIGWFSLNVPSGLSLYYLSNTVLTAAVMIYLKKLGGATITMNDLGPVTKPGSGRRQGVVATGFEEWVPATVMTTTQAKAVADAAAKAAEAAQDKAADDAAAAGASYYESLDGGEDGAAPSSQQPAEPQLDPAKVDRRCRRRRLALLAQQGVASMA